MDERSPSYAVTGEAVEVRRKRRAPRVGLVSGGGKSAGTLEERMAARTVKDPTTGCWNFQGCKVGPNGYGQIDLGGGMRQTAHRVAWVLVHGVIPDHLRVLHSCDNPRCVNVAHLRLGTQAENIHESIQKGRFRAFGRQKLNAVQVLEIRDRAANGEGQGTIAADFGIARHTVSGIVNHKSWAHLRKPVVLEPVPFVLLEVRGEVA